MTTSILPIGGKKSEKMKTKANRNIKPETEALLKVSRATRSPKGIALRTFVTPATVFPHPCEPTMKPRRGLYEDLDFGHGTPQVRFKD